MPLHTLNEAELDPQIRNFYCRSLQILQQHNIPFLVGGAYAFDRHTGIARHTKDLDLFVHSRDGKRAMQAFAQSGYETDLSASHWLGKAFCGENFVDIIFSSANGCCDVDDAWFEYALKDEVLGLPVLVCPAEEMIWSKAFIMARDRFDGADINHLILKCSDTLNWSRLLQRFGDQWRVLFSHLVLFGFAYPGERQQVPAWVMNECLQRLQSEITAVAPEEKLCQGTLLAPFQYLVDVEQWGYHDGRVRPAGSLTAPQVDEWTDHLRQEKGEIPCQ